MTGKSLASFAAEFPLEAFKKPSRQFLETKWHWDSTLNTRPNEVPSDSEYPECESETVSRERAVPCYVLGGPDLKPEVRSASPFAVSDIRKQGDHI